MSETPRAVSVIIRQIAAIRGTLAGIMDLLEKLDKAAEDYPLPEICFCRTCNTFSDHLDNICQRCGSSQVGHEQ